MQLHKIRPEQLVTSHYCSTFTHTVTVTAAIRFCNVRGMKQLGLRLQLSLNQKHTHARAHARIHPNYKQWNTHTHALTRANIIPRNEQEH